jgi:YVTN family beta-propeller protein
MKLRCLAFFTLLAGVTLAQDKPRFAGPTDTGFLLPNGWHLTPAGTHVITTDLPLNIIPLKDGKRAVVATSGYNKHVLSVVDLEAAKVVSDAPVSQSWYGLALSADERKLWWSGGGGNVVHTFDHSGDTLARTGKAEPDFRKMTKAEKAAMKGFVSGLALAPKADELFVLNIDFGEIAAVDPATGEPRRTGKLGGKPYDVLPARNGLLYVSDWAGRQVLAVDPADLRTVARIPVGEHPNQIAAHPKDDRLFVACASCNAVSVIDTKRGVVTETIFTALFPKAPEGSTPDALAVSPDGKTLYVANADNNCVAVIDVEKANESQVKGFIPTGWYPTAVALTPDGKNILVGVGKGLQSKANPKFTAEEIKEKEAKQPKGRVLPYPYIGTTLSGAVSIVPVPDEKQLKEYTAQVYRNCPYSDKLLTTAPHPDKTAIPTRVGDPSPLKHVIYIIKENRTYDQVFGDLKPGNGDPGLVMFGRKVTPNHHKLAEEFVLLDNLYCNGQVSADGHPWSTAAYHTDYVAREWHLTYSGRKGVDDDDNGRLENPPSGYLWDACKRVGLSYRSYGEYGKRVSDGKGGDKFEGRVPGLVGHMAPKYGLPTKKSERVRDSDRVDHFLEEFREYEKTGDLPRFIVMSLPEDHTTGTTPGTFSPSACVASNDLALGRLVEAVSKSKFWPETAIFVIEDDAQNGPDHVDAHRTVGLVISPYTKRKFVDSTQYATVSMIRTMELILGIPPLSQYDAAARPMFASFTAKPDLTPYAHVPAEIDLGAKNDRLAYGADRSKKMDFSDVDRVDDFELNEILWRAVKGKDAPLPPAVRRAIAFRSQAVK